MLSFSIIIPNFNGIKYLGKCLESLSLAIYEFPQNKYEIILVDNASTDNSVNLFANLISPNISSKTILLKKNTGFAYAVNQGIKSAKNEYILICNNDITLQSDWFSVISPAIQKHQQAACFCGTVLNKNGKFIESQGISFDYSGKCILLNHNQSYPGSKIHDPATSPVWGSTAALVIYKKEVLERIGYFDPRYFAFLEDVDLSFRLHQRHYQTILVPLAISYHFGGATADRQKLLRPWLTFRNWLYFILKNYRPTQIIRYSPQILLERLRNLSYLIRSIIWL